jgi:hypothetical protein
MIQRKEKLSQRLIEADEYYADNYSEDEWM